MDSVGYELRTTRDGKGDGVHATRCLDIGETVRFTLTGVPPDVQITALATEGQS